MKFIKKDSNHIILYQSKFQIDAIDFDHSEDLEEQFRILFHKLKEIYGFEMEGYYDIDIYHDSQSGRVIEIKKEPIEYFDYLENQIDMRMVLHEEQPFLYEMNDIFTFPQSLKEKVQIILYQNKSFLTFLHPLTDLELGSLLEFGTIRYKNNDWILKRGTFLT